jgi:hypothetical protein
MKCYNLQYMRGRTPEALEVRPGLSEEERHALRAAALERIETIDGIDYLDGFPLPPDNTDINDPKPYTLAITYLSKEPWQEILEGHSTITNADVRKAHIDCLAQGLPPIYATSREIFAHPELFGIQDRQPTLFQRIRNQLGKLGAQNS